MPAPDVTTQAIEALLAGRGHRVWRVGAAAWAQLAGHATPPFVELLTDAGPEACAEIMALAADLVDTTPVHLQPLRGSLETTLGLRGFTVDAIAVSDGEVVDPTGGLEHLEAGILRTIRPPDRVFRDMPVLLLSMARLIAWTGATPSTELRRFATRDSGNVLDVPGRRGAWGRELTGLLLGPRVDRGLQWLYETRVLGFVAPEVAAMIGFDKTCTVHHKDMWDHTKKVTRKAAPDPVVRWAALCHDIGKVWTRTVTREGKVHFFRHEEHGALLFEGIAHRVGLTAELTARVSYLIENHSRVNLYEGDWTDSAVRRLIRDTEGHLQDLLTFSKADYTTKRTARIEEMVRLLSELEERIARIREGDAREPPLNRGVGNAIMEHFQLAPGRAIGDLKRLLEAAIAAGELPEREEDAVYLRWLADSPDAQALLHTARKRA